MFCCVGKVIIVNNNGIINFGFRKEISPENIQVGSDNGAAANTNAHNKAKVKAKGPAVVPSRKSAVPSPKKRICS
ncbi:hypothetical protein [Paenibacillus protaetiae]|uniref:Uncharacterized protein n=1 Tax=Paenibacillus protaetiae TaxID=2509456 RepID=A0A4P6ERU9_9BACL|nr:hypothetical protein [Paenibacillus protaetiae]QAY65266.1 hypothetical protein ET464_01585 [Paenibacillus protaetiae]